MKAKPLPSLEYLRECFDLDAGCPSGLRWKVRPRCHFVTARSYGSRNGTNAGKPAGAINTDQRTGRKYFCVGIAGSRYQAHRIVYSMFNSIELSVDTEIDHIDVNSLNNSYRNLRIATHGENQHNEGLRKNNISGVKGVCRHKESGRWMGRVMHNGTNHFLGYSSSLKVMEGIVREFREKLHKEFSNHGE